MQSFSGLLTIVLKALVVCGLVWVCGPIHADTQNALVHDSLRPGEVVRGQLAEGEVVTFGLRIENSGLLLLVAQQQGIDFRMTIRDPEGRELGNVGTPLDRKGSMRWVGELRAGGMYQVELRALDDSGASGDYRLHAVDLSQASVARVEAERAMTLAGALDLDNSSASVRRAKLTNFSQALSYWSAVSERTLEMEVIYSMARLSLRLDDGVEDAVGYLEEAVSLAAELNNLDFEASALADLGLAHRQLGQLALAEEYLRRSVDLYRTLSDAFGEGTALNTLCMISQSRGFLRQALRCYEEALKMMRENGYASHEAAILHNRGYALDSLGEPLEARATYLQALEANQRAGDRLGQAMTMNNLAAATFRADGDLERALEHYDQARHLLEELGDRWRLAIVVHNQGYAYLRNGNPRRALAFFENALAMQQEVGNVRGEAGTLNGIGLAHREMGALTEAITAHGAALKLARQVGRQRGEALSLAYLGRVLVDAEQPADGLQRLNEAIEILGDAEDKHHSALAWNQRAVALLTVGRTEEAESSARRALTLRREISDGVGEAETLGVLAEVSAKSGNLEQALSQVRTAISLVEQARARMMAPELRMSFLAARASVYESAIDILMQKHWEDADAGFDQQALLMSERSKARTLFELLHEPRVAAQYSESNGLLEERKELLARINAKASRLTVLLGTGLEDSESSLSLKAEIEAVLASLDLVESQLRKNGVELSIHQPDVGISDVQLALDSETVLLEYSLGRQRSFLWCVTREGVSSHVLPARSELEADAKEVHGLWSTPHSSDRQRETGLVRRLSQTLVGPAVDLLAGRKAVVVVPDGALHALPFAALELLTEEGEWEPLLVNSEVLHIPSVSVVLGQRATPRKPHREQEQVAVFADPVFNLDDERMQSVRGADGGSGKNFATEPVAELFRTSGILNLQRLPATRLEAETIAAMMPEEEAWIALGQEANRLQVMDGRVARYRYLHFATHGIASEEIPELSGIALSMVSAEGAEIDGFLRLRDIYELELSAELVVLSGCRTALGKSVRGEGPVGLVRSFLAAGAKSVIASLWWVEDHATARLMSRLYIGLLKEGLRPSEALRHAQLELRQHQRFADPFYWASFVYQGEW